MFAEVKMVRGGDARGLLNAVAAATLAAVVDLPLGAAQCFNGTWVNGTDVLPCEPEPEPEVHEPHRVSVLVVPGLIGFYSVVLALEVFGYSLLRTKHEKGFEKAKEEGDIVDVGGFDFNARASRSQRKRAERTSSDPPADEPDVTADAAKVEPMKLSTDEKRQAAMLAQAEQDTLVDRMCEFIFISIGDAENTKEMGLDAAMYLAHLQLCSAFWTLQSLSAGIALVTCYQVFGVESGLNMYTWSYANLREEYRWISVAAAVWMVVTTVVFATYRGKVMDRLKLRVGYGDLRSTTTLWFENVPNHLKEKEINDWFVSRYPDAVDATRLALDVHELGTNIRTRRRIILKINATVEKLERKQAALILAGNALNPLSRGPPVRPFACARIFPTLRPV
jgi:hypothetical protein